VLLGDDRVGVLFFTNGGADLPPVERGPEFQLDRYGSPTPVEIVKDGPYVRNFRIVLDRRMEFIGGSPRYMFTINGSSFPDTRLLMVEEGDQIKMTIINRSEQDNPMHLHGHYALVLERSGRAATGSLR